MSHTTTPSGRRPRRASALVPALAMALLGACSSSEPPAAATAGAESQPQHYIKVEAVGVDGEGLQGTFPGRLAFRPGAMAAVGAPLAGRVLSVEVHPGQAVRAGAPLVVLQSAEAADVRAALEQARTRLAVAQDLLRRQEDMMARGIGVEVERYSAEAALREAQAEAARARQAAALAGAGNGDRLVLRAPAAGVVLAIQAQAGAVAAPGGDALVELGDPGQLWIVAEVPERELGGLAPGRAAQVRVPGIDAPFAAAIDSIGHAVDPEQRRMPIYLAFQDKTADAGLTAGMFAQVSLAGGPRGAPTVPSTAVLIKNGSQRQVYLQGEDGNYVARPVRTGIARAGRVEILEGLKAGDKVVVQGALLLDNEAQQLL